MAHLPILKQRPEPAERLHRHRADMIARTETLRVANQGNHLVRLQARDQGLIQEARTMHQWITTPDDRMCDDCMAMDGQLTALEGAFSTLFGPVGTAPMHPGCRCTDIPTSVRYSKDHNESERKANHIIKSLVETTESEAQLDSFFVPIRRIDREQQKVWGVVLQPNTPDAHGHVMSADEIEKTVHNFLRRSRVIGVGHNRPVNADPVESYFAPVDFQTGDETVLAGSWVMGVQIDDGEQWEMVKTGELTGFSPGGSAQRDPIY